MVTLRDLEVRHAGKGVIFVPYLRFEPGNTYVVYGPSGSGKTSLVNILLGKMRPAAGEYFWETDNLLQQPNAEGFLEIRVGYMHETPFLFAGTAGFNLGLVCNGPDAETLKHRQRELVHHFGARDLLERKISQLSRGEKQVIALIRALTLSRGLLLLDEPFNGLDERGSQKLIELINEGKIPWSPCVVVFSRFLSHARSIKGHLLHVIDGEIRKREFNETELVTEEKS